MPTLYIVATPIGNIEDWSPRAVRTLENVDLILCEDTRHSAPLLTQFGIKTPTKAFHDHNEREATAWVLQQLQDKDIALISDAGTPLISDPGYFLAKSAQEAGIKVVPVPGCCAFVTALSASGLPSDRFSFRGFLPAAKKDKREALVQLEHEQSTTIFYESTHRILDTVTTIVEVLGARNLCLARELTKQFETIVTAPAPQVLAYLQESPHHVKGEFVLIIDKGTKLETSIDANLRELIKQLMPHHRAKDLAKMVSAAYGLANKEVYNYILSLKDADA